MDVNLVGRFHIDKSNLLKPDLHLVIGTRRKPSPNKPKHYLLIKAAGQFSYLSSLYPFDQDMPVRSLEAEIYSLEWEGVNYLLTVNTGLKQAEISLLRIGSNAAMPLKGGGGGSTCP